ncbi:hypothetical protein FOT98_08910 [Bacillus sp. HY001]|uniref:hypothetical protein n=1 Tax=Bacillus TaxID=1386 RepID=UPI00118555D9|nr:MULTISPECIES: hypothetical protein [Bacillus]TSI19903.1 hypothetical protein FOT98_08910 [Bacillus sp. HY001]
MNRIIGVISRGLNNLTKNIKAIVNTVSQPKDKANGGIYTGTSPVTIGEAGTDHVISKSSKLFSDFEKEVAQKRNVPEELYQNYVKVVKEAVENTMRSIESKGNYSINRQLSINKKKTQQRNWSKWKRRNR